MTVLVIETPDGPQQLPGATYYQHPASHPASMIEESESKKFVSQTEKDLWNAGNAQSILTKPVEVEDFTGTDGYILAYDETNDRFYLKADEPKGGDSGLSIFESSAVNTLSLSATLDVSLYAEAVI